MKKKLLSVLVVFAMVLTLLTTVAFATNVAASNSDAEITWSSSDSTSLNDGITFSGNGAGDQAVTFSDEVNYAHTVTINATEGTTNTVTFKGSQTVTINEIVIEKGTLVIEKTTTPLTELTVTNGITVKGGASLQIGDQKFTAEGTSVKIDGTKGKLVPANAEITISSGEGSISAPATGAVTVKDQKITFTAAGKVDAKGHITASTDGSVSVNDIAFTANNNSLDITLGASADNEIAVSSANIASLGSGKKISVNDTVITGDESAANIEVKSGPEVTLTSGKITIGSGEISKLIVKSDSSPEAVIGGKSYKATADATLAISDGTVTASAGTVELGNEAAVTLSGSSAKAKTNGGKEISGDGATVTGGSGSATVVSTSSVTVDSKTYTGSANMTVADGGDVTLTSGTVTLGEGATIKTTQVSSNDISSNGATVKIEGGKTVVTTNGTTAVTISGKTWTPAEAAATLEFTSDDNPTVTTGEVTLSSDAGVTVGGTTVKGNSIKVDKAGKVTLGTNTATVGESKTYQGKADGAAITVAGESDVTLTSNKVELGSGASIKVSGQTISGDGLEVNEDGTVAIGSGETATVGIDTFAAQSQDATIKIVSGGVEVSSITSGGTLKVTDDDKSLNVTYKNITFKGDAYTLSEDTDDVKVALESGKKVTATFSGNQKIKTESTLKNGDNEDGAISGNTITGKSGATVEFTGGSNDITVKGTGNTKVNSDNSGSLEVSTPPSTSTGGSSSPSTTVDKPATDAASGETKVDVNTNSTTSGTTAKATVSDTNMDKAVNSAVDEAKKQGTAPVVEVEVKTSDKADSLNVTLPAASLEKLAEAEDASLIVTSDIAQVALDNTALTALAEQAAGSTVTLEVAPVAASALNEAQAEAVGEADVVDLSLVSNGVVIHDYNNGKITVTLPYKLGEGKDPASVQVYFLDDNGALTPCATSYDSKAGKVTFTTVHLSKYVIADAELGVEKDCPSAKYADVDQTKWYHEGVDYAIKNGLMNGTGADTFAPNATTTRAMIVTILYRLDGEPAVTENTPFEDVPDGKWYADAISWAAANGIVTGYSETQFGPNDPITREQMAAILYRYASYKGYDVSVGEDTNILSYTDASSISEYAIPAMQWAAGSGLMEGTSAATLSPKGSAVRAQAATILMRFCESVAK